MPRVKSIAERKFSFRYRIRLIFKMNKSIIKLPKFHSTVKFMLPYNSYHECSVYIIKKRISVKQPKSTNSSIWSGIDKR